MRRGWLAALGLMLAACSKSSDAPPPAETTSAPRTTAASAAPPHVGVGASAASTDAAPRTDGSWSGHYSATPGAFYVPEGSEWAGVRFRGEDASVGLGDGTLTLTVDPTGRVQGTLDGALGPLRVNGDLTGSELGAALSSTDPEHGFTGTAVGTLVGDHVTGTMRLSLPTGNVLRAATFMLEKSR